VVVAESTGAGVGAVSTGTVSVVVVSVVSVFSDSEQEAKKPKAIAKIESFTKFFIFIFFNCLMINTRF